MATTHQLLRIAARDAGANATDGALLLRYVAERDEAAFAELVRRNGPVVFRACRHVLGEATAAEDAFQATFLLLAREAQRLTRPGSLAGWLHAAAVRVARGARRTDVRARRRESAYQLPQSKPDPDDLSWREVRAILDAELAALPEKYRVPVVLCYFQDLSYEAAARRIGCPVGTLRGRLERGKERLRKRLSRHGLPLAAPVLIVGCPPPVSAALTEAALGVIRSAKGGTVPPALAGLLPPTGRLRAVLLLAPTVTALVVIGASLAASGFLAHETPKVDPPEPAAPTTEVVPRPLLDRLGDPLPPGAVARLGTRRMFGGLDQRWAAFSHDGKQLATLDYSWFTTIFDATTGRTVVQRKLGVFDRAIGWRADGAGIAVVQLPDFTLFVSSFSDPNERLPNPPEPAAGAGRAAPDGYGSLALSPDATQMAAVRDASGNRFTVDILPATVGQPVANLKPVKTLGPFDGPCREIRYTPRGLLIFSGSWDEGDWTISFLDLKANAITRTISIPTPAHCAWGLMCSLSPDGRFAAIPTQPRGEKPGHNYVNQHDGTIHLWNLETGKDIGTIPLQQYGYGTGHAFTPDGKHLITSGSKPYFQIWDVESRKEVIRCPLPDLGSSSGQEAVSVAVNSDGKRFARVRRDGRIEIWNTATGEPTVTFDTHREPIVSVTFSPDTRLAATAGRDSSVRVWELATGKLVRAIPAPGSQPPFGYARRWRLTFTPDGRGLMFTASGQLVLVDPATGGSLDLPGRLRGYRGVVGGFTSDGKTLATIAGDVVTLWNWPAGNERLSLTVPLAGKESDAFVVRLDYPLCLSPDGRFLFTNSLFDRKKNPGGDIHNANDVWDARSGKHLHRLKKPTSLHPPAGFSPDGRVMYLGGRSADSPSEGMVWGDALTAWDPLAGKLVRRFVEPDRPDHLRDVQNFGRNVQALAVSPDGRLLAASDEPGQGYTVWLYETTSGRPLKQLTGHIDHLSDLTFSPDRRRLVSVSADQTGLVWDVTLPALVTGRVGKPTAKDLTDAWDRLGGTDPVPGYLGIATLVAAPADAVALLKAKLQPAPVPTNADLDRITTQLGADAPADREKASAELELFGPNAVAGVRARLAQAESAEVRDRLTRFLSRYSGPNPSPYDIRCVRGVAALEEIGTDEAKELLNHLARGKADDALTREATAAHRRVSNR
ncbi:sigma-70 family RNA polymerase sigma factor [Frigoriglobus tundricola]|uniref:ECF RNA polymerase sigma factor SigE n=1 Tax=Frigoriglobus tundricola TaxID=2774151 RepID=A0A6M5YY74_9BACT|nr:sigma-70 family RNA polymerase sigma factor [Frigoriglobus tundricola]QJW99067.1 hypothetical protein FTUN_6665 [Frigoriglobus tundricola]